MTEMRRLRPASTVRREVRRYTTAGTEVVVVDSTSGNFIADSVEPSFGVVAPALRTPSQRVNSFVAAVYAYFGGSFSRSTHAPFELNGMTYTAKQVPGSTWVVYSRTPLAHKVS